MQSLTQLNSRCAVPACLRSPAVNCLPVQCIHRRGIRQTLSLLVRSQQDDGRSNSSVPPPPPPPPMQESSMPDLGTLKSQYEGVYLPIVFVIGSLTFGLKTSLDNFAFGTDPVGFILCAATCGGIVTAIAWVLADFIQEEPAKRR